MPSKKNVEKLNEYRELLRDVKSIVVADYRGLTVAEAQELRRKARELKASYKVVKNRIFKLALKEKKELEPLVDYFVETRAIAFSKKDEVAPAKLIVEFGKKSEHLKVITGYLDGEILTPERINELAKLPSKDELIAKIAADIQAPVQYIACGVNAVMQKLAIAIEEIRKKLESEKASA